MSRLEYDGPGPNLPADILDEQYITNNLLPLNLTQAQVDSMIAAGFAPYCPTAYVDQQDALNATQPYIDGIGGANPNGGDAARLHINQINVNGGVPGLDATGKVQIARVNVPSAQRYPQGYWNPVSYNTSTVQAGAETALYSCPLSDPGIRYKLFVTGAVDAGSWTDGQGPIINVRVGSPSGPLVAQGRGLQEHYFWGTDNWPQSNGSNLGPKWAQAYYGPSGGGGVMASPTPGLATWTPSGTVSWGCRAQRVYPADARTLTDMQWIRYQVGLNPGQVGTPIDSNPANDMYARMSADGQTFVRCITTPSSVQLYYSINGNEGPLTGTVPVTQSGGDIYDFFCGFGGGLRTFQVSHEGVAVLNYNDPGYTAVGPAYRGWGLGMYATQATLLYIPVGQHLPAQVMWSQIFDPYNPAYNDNFNYAQIPVLPLPLSAQSPLTGPTTLWVTCVATDGGSTMLATAVAPNLTVMAIPA